MTYSQLYRKGARTLVNVLYHANKNNVRYFETSAPVFCLPKDKEPPSFNSPHHTHKNEMLAAAPTTTVSHQTQTNQTQYEPTLIANPAISTTTIKSQNDSTTPQSFQTSVDESLRSEMVVNRPGHQIAERDSLTSLLHEVDPKTLSQVFYFDSLALSKKLEAKGFTRAQAEGCVECLVDIIGNTLEHQARHMVTKTEQRITEQQLLTEIMSVKKDMVLLQKSEFSALRTETEKMSLGISRIQSDFQDELVKLKGQFTLDVNLERGRAIEAHAASEKNLQIVDNKIETEIAHLQTTYERYRNDIFKYAAGTVLTCTTLIVGFIRLWK